jgi:ligand-binding sensor domain-containing protein/two-component sensor histidine kinase
MKSIIIVILFFLSSIIVELLPTPRDYTFIQLGIEDGLSQSTVFTSLQDKTGYMWFGTSSGLNKFDGYKFTVYLNDPSDSSSIAGEVIVSLFEDKQETLWIGSIEGYLNKYNRLNDSFSSINIALFISERQNIENDYYEYPLSFSRNHNTTITSIIEDDKGYIWLGTWGNGILVIDKNFNLVDHFYSDSSKQSSLPTNRVTKLSMDSNGIIWIGTFGGGLVRCDQSENGSIKFAKYSVTRKNNSLSDDKIITLFSDSNSNLWIGTFYGGLNFLSNEEKFRSPKDAQFLRFEPNSTPNSISNKTVMSLCEDKSNNIWIGTFGSGLDRYNPMTGRFLNFRHDPMNKNSLADNDVLSISVERSGIIWAGSHLGSGITKIQRSKAKFNLLSHQQSNPNSLSDNVVWAVYEDSDKKLWVGTYRGGVNIIDRRTNHFRYLMYDPSDKNTISSNHIRAICEDNFGNIWAGTYNRGLNLIQKKTFKIKRILSGNESIENLSSDQIQSLLIEDEEYWIGTFGGGLNYAKSSDNPFFSTLKFKRFVNNPEDDNSLSDNRVYKVFKDSKNNIWVGTFGGGLNKFVPGTGSFKHYRYDPQDNRTIADDKIISIHEDSEGFLWIGTYGGGLNKFDPSTEKFQRITQQDGLLSSVIYGILEDRKKNIWLSTDNGIFTINFNTKKISRYDILDGLQSREFSGGSYFKSESGELFFGGINGLNYFYPDSISVSTFLPEVIITSIKIQNERIKGNPNNITLDYNKNFISFEFSALDFSNPKENSYSFILEGFDKNWQPTTSERRAANYTNLPPGSYIFRVRGSNSDGIWSDNEATFMFSINPPIWLTWWFISITAILLGLIIYYISTLRIKNLLSIEKLKTKLAADLHDNVGSGLTEISILSELAAFKAGRNDSTLQKELKIISELSRQLIDNMSDIVWVVNPQRDSLHDLIVRLKNSYDETLDSLGIAFRVSNLEKLKDIKLPIDFKQNLYLILKEAINNAIKHSKCSIIKLEANARKDIIEVSVTDDGIGLNEKSLNIGNGIKNIKQRAKSIGGRVRWKSTPNKGTSLRFVGRRSALSKIKSFFKNKRDDSK